MEIFMNYLTAHRITSIELSNCPGQVYSVNRLLKSLRNIHPVRIPKLNLFVDILFESHFVKLRNPKQEFTVWISRFCQAESCLIFVIQRNVHYAANTWRLWYSSCQMKYGLRLLATFGLFLRVCQIFAFFWLYGNHWGVKLDFWNVDVLKWTLKPRRLFNPWCNALPLRDEPREKRKKKNKT